MEPQKKNTSRNGNSLRSYNNSYIQEKDNTTRNVWLCVCTFVVCLVVGSICLTMAKVNGLKENNTILNKQDNKTIKEQIENLQEDIDKSKNKIIGPPPPTDDEKKKFNQQIDNDQKQIHKWNNQLEAQLCILEKIEYRTDRRGYTRKRKKLEFQLENCSGSVNMLFAFGVGLLVIAFFLFIGCCCLLCMLF